MATVVYSAAALAGIERACLKSPRAAQAIQSATGTLAENPLIGRRIEGELRALAVSRGLAGHLVVYRFLIERDEVRVLALKPLQLNPAV